MKAVDAGQQLDEVWMNAGGWVPSLPIVNRRVRGARSEEMSVPESPNLFRLIRMRNHLDQRDGSARCEKFPQCRPGYAHGPLQRHLWLLRGTFDELLRRQRDLRSGQS
jgi:hypothetical protein